MNTAEIYEARLSITRSIRVTDKRCTRRARMLRVEEIPVPLGEFTIGEFLRIIRMIEEYPLRPKHYLSLGKKRIYWIYIYCNEEDIKPQA